tara:strand:+ start:1259 stop:2026 length:768 start_codon:yes stop_codon:yes gene_type:complete
MNTSLKIQATTVFILLLIISPFENILTAKSLVIVLNYMYSFGILIIGFIKLYKFRTLKNIPWYEMLLLILFTLLMSNKHESFISIYLGGVVICLLFLFLGHYLVKNQFEKIMNYLGKNNLVMTILILAALSLSFSWNSQIHENVITIEHKKEWLDIDSLDSRPATIFKIKNVRKNKLFFLPVVSKDIHYYFHYNGVRFNGISNTEILEIKLKDEFYAEFPVDNPEKSTLNFQKPFDIISIIKGIDTTSTSSEADE